MKKNLVSVVVIVVLFGALGLFALGSKGESAGNAEGAKDQANAVKICPNSGLPCDGDGECGGDCE